MKLHTKGLVENLSNVAFGCVVISIGIVGWQSYHWLQTGEWYPYSIDSAYSTMYPARPLPNWLGVRKIVEWFLACPLSAAFLALAFFVGWMRGGLVRLGQRSLSWVKPN